MKRDDLTESNFDSKCNFTTFSENPYFFSYCHSRDFEMDLFGKLMQLFILLSLPSFFLLEQLGIALHGQEWGERRGSWQGW